MFLNNPEFPKFVDWIGQRLHDLLHGEGSRSAPQPALVPAAPDSNPNKRPRPTLEEGERAPVPVDAKLYSYGQPGYGSPQGYGPPPKSGGGSSIAIIIGVILVMVLGGGVVVCGGIGYFFVRASKEFEAQAQQAMNEADMQFAPMPGQPSPPIGDPSTQGSTFPGMPQLDLSPQGAAPGSVSPSAPTKDPLGEIVTEETTIAVGDKLLAEWGGQWWKVEVIETLPDGRVKVHYEGWSDIHDEVMVRAKLRLRSE